jgi:hypothetical protein
MAKFTPADEQQRIAEQERQLQRAIKAFAGNIQEKEFSNLELTVMIDGEERTCEYSNHQFIDLESMTVVDVHPGQIVGAKWKTPTGGGLDGGLDGGLVDDVPLAEEDDDPLDG